MQQHCFKGLVEDHFPLPASTNFQTQIDNHRLRETQYLNGSSLSGVTALLDSGKNRRLEAHWTAHSNYPQKNTHAQGVLSHNCCVYKTSRKTINKQNCNKYMAPRNNGRQKLPNSQLSLMATSYAAAQNCGHKQKHAKKRDGGKKNPPDPNPGGQKANQNTWTNSKIRANIKINTRKYGYVHVIDLHKQMSKGEGRQGGGEGGGSSRDAKLRQVEKQNGTEIGASKSAPRSALWRKFLVVFEFWRVGNLNSVFLFFSPKTFCLCHGPKNGNFPSSFFGMFGFSSVNWNFLFFSFGENLQFFISEDWRKDRPIAPTFIEDVKYWVQIQAGTTPTSLSQ